uniref:Uncharacterized protein n=1 Tax=Oryza punctata TaxID=4537 RepID=A0A0E0LF94_ORYPU
MKYKQGCRGSTRKHHPVDHRVSNGYDFGHRNPLGRYRVMTSVVASFLESRLCGVVIVSVTINHTYRMSFWC